MSIPTGQRHEPKPTIEAMRDEFTAARERRQPVPESEPGAGGPEPDGTDDAVITREAVVHRNP